VVDPLYEQEREGRVLTFQRHLTAIEELIGDYRGKRLLDVGAYTGVFVELAREHGWDAYGIELSLWAAELCHQKGLNVKRGTLNDLCFSDNYFDVITSWDVIEHLNDPHTHLEDIHRILKPGGLLVIHTIDIDAPFARLMGARWPWLMEMHLVYFSRRTLALMLEDVGFDVIRAEAEGRYQKISYLISRLNAVSERLWHLTDWLSRLLRVDQLPVPIKLGDLVTTVSIKKDR
jgi:2-polyprenyl-3-methyl-5-hydroxy-6-metoxy-1,4-benzoquinol methylase